MRKSKGKTLKLKAINKSRDAAKEMLAKLLATENISVVHGKFSTASFNLKTRELRLPTWRNLGEDVHDLLVLHEVAHALYTPAQGFHSVATSDDRGSRYKSFLNVVEDARIEKKIKRKYPGAHAPMLRGYDVIMEKDLFGVRDVDVDELSLVDRINLHFKLGSYLPIEFKNEEEKEILKLVSDAETWEDVVAAANRLWDYCSEESKSMFDIDDFDYDMVDDDGEGEGEYSETYSSKSSSNKDRNGNQEEDFFGGEKGENDPSQQNSESEESSGDDSKTPGDNETKDPSNNQFGNGEIENDLSEGGEGGKNDLYQGEDKTKTDFSPRSITDESWQRNQEEIVDPEAVIEHYISLPNIAYKDYLVSYSEIETRSYNIWKKECADCEDNEIVFKKEGPAIWQKVRAKNKRTVEYLAKEFEMRKRAREYSRSKTAKTGSIDSTKVWKHKISEDIFNRVTVIPEGKSHGMVMLLDWSSSMSNSMSSSIEQVLVLALFCRKVGIPFRVFSFTDTFYRIDKQEIPRNYLTSMTRYTKNYRYEQQTTKFKENDLCPDDFHLIEFLNSSMKAAEFTRAAELLCILAQNFNLYSYGSRYYSHDKQQESVWDVNYQRGGIPGFLSLGGTPLNSSLTAIPNLLEDFKKSTKADIVSLVLVTDGDSHGVDSIVMKNNDQFYNNENYQFREKESIIQYVLKQGYARVDGFSYIVKKLSLNPFNKNGVAMGIVDPVSKEKILYRHYDKSFYRSQTYALIDLIKQRTGVRVVNFFITNNGKMAIRDWVSSLENFDQLVKDYRRRKSVVLKGEEVHAFDAVCIVNNNNMNIEEEKLTIDTTKTRGSMAREFKKYFSNKLTQRVLMNEFAKMVS